MADKRLGSIIKAFAGLALFVAEQRTKEIGIRKVLGASIPNIFYLLAWDFIKWIPIANIIAGPLAAFAMTRYLDSYAYHMKLGLVVFLIPVAIILMVALLTVSWQALRAATADPVRSLRYE